MLRWFALAALVVAGCVSAADAQEHVSTKDFELHVDNTAPSGIWSNGTTMWVVDQTRNKIYAYGMSDKLHDGMKDFDMVTSNSYGIWSDGTTMWVADSVRGKIFAYRMSDQERVSSKDFNTLNANNTVPTGIWSDGNIMWVANSDSGDMHDKIYAYTYPAPPVPPPRVFVYVPPPDTTPPTVKSVERAGNATTTNHTLTWDVRFSEWVRVGMEEIHTNHASMVNATIPDLGTVSDTILVDVPGTVTGGSVSVDMDHRLISGLSVELVAPDCTRFVVHNQTVTFFYKLRQSNDLGNLTGVEAAGQWTLSVSDHKQLWDGTLYGWTLDLESIGAVEGRGSKHTFTQHVAGPGNYTLSLAGYKIRDSAGNSLRYTEPAVNEPYHVIGTAARTCQTE